MLSDGWARTGTIPSIERDMALEKLRRIYEELLVVSVPSAVPAHHEVPETSEPLSINLDEVLSVDFPAPEEESVPDDVAADKAEEVPVSAESDAEPHEEPEPADEPEESPAAEPEVEVELIFADDDEADESEPEAAVSPEESSSNDMTSAEPRQAEDTLPEPSETLPEEPQTSEHISDTIASVEVEPVADAQPDSGEEKEVMHEEYTVEESKEAEPHDTPKTEVVAETHKTVVQSLFGPEDPEELRRHKNKQRILMSLYDMPETEPAVPKPQHAETSYPALQAEAHEVEEQVMQSDMAEAEVQMPKPESAAEVDSDELLEITELEVETEIEQPVASEQEEASVESQPEKVDLSVEEEPVVMPRFQTETTTVHQPEQPAATVPAGVLGEVINHDVRTLGDELRAPRHNVASELARRESVDDLRKAIGINDKFLMIRDLFGGDAAAYDRAIDTLNTFDDLDDCLIHIAEHYAWNPNSDGAKLLMELLERKLS